MKQRINVIILIPVTPGILETNIKILKCVELIIFLIFSITNFVSLFFVSLVFIDD
jgi:hypothetical protein